MILYFSATGNSKALAYALASKLDDKAISINEMFDNHNFTIDLANESSIGFVFPIYGWSLPNNVKVFIQNLKIENYNSQYVYFAVTCGDDMGVADIHIRKALDKCGLKLCAGFSIIMPDCYINLPGFDVDKDEERKRKLGAFNKRVDEMVESIKDNKQIMDIKRGGLPYTKTYVLGGLFRKFLVTDKPFHSTDDCTNCGTCVKICPVHNIKLSDNSRPEWQGNCVGCLACYHHCPTRAIRFGKQTEKKGQYLLAKHKDEIC